MAKRPISYRGKFKLSFADQFFPARPQNFWRKAARVATNPLSAAIRLGTPNGANRNYVNWLKKESMLRSADILADRYVGRSRMWQNPFARPRPRAAIRKASVWYTAYPMSMVTAPGQTIVATLGDDKLWRAFQDIGIQGLHTGPMKLAGGINGWKFTPSIDGHFDRISNRIDPLFGTEREFQRMSTVAAQHGGIVIDDIVPGHTGKGADFRLAEMKYRDYPGIYHMVEIAPEDMHLLPPVPAGQDSVNIDPETESELKSHGYIIGKLQRVIFYEPGVKETNWSATKPVRGVDGVTRRWVYLHYFKEGQPSINWLDPSVAGMKLVMGDAVHSLGDLGATGLRLDANGFLGVEKTTEDAPAWSEGHPLSEAANLLIAGLVRKLGGFTFQELNLTFDDIKTMSQSGADLSYDFINRPAYHHALAVGDTEFLRLTLRASLEYGIDPASLVHAMQNHDDLTYELVHFWTLHKDDEYVFRGEPLKGSELRETIRREMQECLTGPGAPYNLLFTTNGIACTTASIITAAVGYKEITALETADVETIKQVHLLLVMFNALQPGVFALSGWDLTGALPLPAEAVEALIADGDTRWINRGAYDLMGMNPPARASSAGIPKAVSLYGTLPEQLADAGSFAWQLRNILRLREKHCLATAHQVDIPDVAHKSMLVMVHRLQGDKLQATVLNFGSETISGTVRSEHLPPEAQVTDMFTEQEIGSVDDLHSFPVELEPYQGLSLLIQPPTEENKD